MSAMEIGTKMVALCREGKYEESVSTLYGDDIESVEAVAMEGMDQVMKGIEAVRGKNKWWIENHEVHSQEIDGPWPHGDRFAVRFKFDVTNKPSGQRMQMDEISVYTVSGDKIVKEEFFYSRG